MEIKVFIHFFTKLIICMVLVFSVPHLISRMFPVFWVDDPLDLKTLVGFVYLLGSWGLLGLSNLITHHPEDQGFTGFGNPAYGKPFLLRAIVSSFCWLVSLFVMLLPFIGWFSV